MASSYVLHAFVSIIAFNLSDISLSFTGEVSGIVVAKAGVQALDMEFAKGQIYEINSV